MTPKTVQLFATCLVNELYPEVGFSVAKVLESLGWKMEVPEGQVCCGQPAFNAGYNEDALGPAWQTVQVLAATEGPILVPSGSCGDMLAHHLPTLFAEGSVERAKADSVAARVREFSQFLVDDLGVDSLGGSCAAKVAYHPSCHLMRGLGVKEQPLKLLGQVEGTQVVDFKDSEECCGFGGSFSVTHDAISGAMLDDKLAKVSAAQPERLVSCDLGCLMHLEGGLRKAGQPLKVQHLAQYLAESLP